MNLSQAYLAGAAEFAAIVGRLGPAELETLVPACPAWTVHDLLAHQAGSSTDFVARNLEGVASAPWTARQVEARRGSSAASLVAEWQTNAEAVAPLCDVIPGPNPAWDTAVHLADLREALGLAVPPDDDGWREVLAAARTFLADRGATLSVAESGPDPMTTEWHFATEYGLWRALFSRLDHEALAAEVVRGDPVAFAAVAFFAP